MSCVCAYGAGPSSSWPAAAFYQAILRAVSISTQNVDALDHDVRSALTSDIRRDLISVEAGFVDDDYLDADDIAEWQSLLKGALTHLGAADLENE
jgi:hypothetical protein